MKPIWLLWIVLVSGIAAAQNCDQVVYDGANVLNGREQQIEQAAQALIDKGADVRVRTVAHTVNLDVDEAAYERDCASWRSGSNRKTTLVSLMVAPQDRKLGIYYGAAWHKALDDHWNRIKQEYMVPYFKNGDWVGGFVATEGQLAARIAASKDEAVHPATSTVINQAAPSVDYSEVWEWLLLFLAGIVGIGLLIQYLNRRRDTRDEISDVQHEALTCKNYAARKINDLRDADLSPTDRSLYDNTVRQYSDAANSVKYDPSVDGQNLADYRMQRDLYKGIYNNLKGLGLPKAAPAPRRDPEPRVTVRDARVTPAPQVVKETTVIHDNSSDFATGVVLGSIFGSERRSEESESEAPRHHHRDDDDSSGSSSWSSSSSDSGSGGSSSWTSSDSGGGGGFDFGGGGDSGGGGSSGF